MNKKQKYQNHRGTYFEWDEIQSPAFFALTGKALQVLALLYAKRNIKRVKGKPGRGKAKIIANNGKIELTYTEAKSYGISQDQFKLALDRLVECGWIDVEVVGAGIGRAKNLFCFVQRWRNFGTTDFVIKKRIKRIPPYRFPKGNVKGRANSAPYGTP